MKPYELSQFYPKDHFATEGEAKAWIEWAAPHLDKRDYNYAEQRGDRWVIVQDVKPVGMK